MLLARYVFEELPQGPNLNMRGSKAHGYLRREAQRKCRASMTEVLNRTAPPLHVLPIDRYTLEMVFYLPTQHDRDIRNLACQCKPYIDELVVQGILAGDSWKNVDTELIKGRYRKGWPGFEILIWGVE